MIDKDLIITQQDLVDWIDRPPSNDDLDLCSYLSNAVKNQYEYHKEIERLNNIIDELEKYINEELENYTIEIENKNKGKLGYTLPIKGEIKNILYKLNELKGDNK